VTDLADRLSPRGDDGDDADGGDDGSATTKGERTRQRLLTLAVERFGERGFRAASVSEIARSAGLTQAAVYAYFDNKDALFKAAVDADASALIDEISGQIDDTDVRQLIPTIIVHAVATLPRHPLAQRVLEGKEPDEVARLGELHAIERFSSLLAAGFEAGQQAGDVRGDFDPCVLADGVVALVLGLLFSTALSGGVPAAPRQIVGVVEAFDLMLRPSE
jgi:AcrR family transcriptional regulator